MPRLMRNVIRSHCLPQVAGQSPPKGSGTQQFLRQWMKPIPKSKEETNECCGCQEDRLAGNLVLGQKHGRVEKKKISKKTPQNPKTTTTRTPNGPNYILKLLFITLHKKLS